jgi:heterotetrameric sarcosine oxidase gamma subunit
VTDLTPITALGGAAPRVEAFGALTLCETADLGLASLALRRGQDAPTPFGLTLPDVGRIATTDGYGAFWTGRDQWMIEGTNQGTSDFAAHVRAEAPHAIVTEQTDGFVAFDILSAKGAGPVENLMRKLANVDPRALNPGTVTRTGLEHMTVFLIRRGPDHLTVLGMRTLAGALWHALSVAAQRLEDHE